jgi:hypothetical protein
MTVTVCLPATELISIDAMASVGDSGDPDHLSRPTPEQRTHPAHRLRAGRKLVVPRDARGGVVISDGERASLI